MNKEEQKTQILESCSQLIDTYNDDDFMLQKIQQYVCNQLPNILTNVKQQQIQREVRKIELTSEQDDFIKGFLTNNQYFYAPNNNNFFIYDGLHYKVYSEDNILYHVLSSLSKHQHLTSWKHKTKVHIMKKIKENNLLSSIPESDTIQGILDVFTSTLFSSRELAKYFLCILGDNLLKKETQLVHFIQPYAKEFIKQLNSASNLIVGQSLGQTFKHKYYEHEYENFRIININNTVKQDINWQPILSNYSIDILCVACYYSNRFGNSDEYMMNHCNNPYVMNNVLFIKNTTPELLVSKFIYQYIDDVSNIRSRSNSISSENSDSERTLKSQITWKNMQYLWKLFLDDNEIPSVIFMNQLKTLIIKQLQNHYKENLDIFEGIFSKFLPTIQHMLQFWNNNIVQDENESLLEVEELLTLFKIWTSQNHISCTNVSTKQIIDLITYYYPNIEIEQEKYFTGISCTMWNKHEDIQMSIEMLKEELRTSDENDAKTTSVYDVYLYYCKFANNTPYKLVVSKVYFEKYIFEHYTEYISDNKVFSNDWLN